jgi:regulator of sirC expression with transglutaminase-like and TPR domain
VHDAATARFATMIALSPSSLANRLDEALLVIAACSRGCGEDAVDLGPTQRALDALAAALGPAATADALMHHVFEEAGFRGNADDYYDPRNSYLDAVVERRLGIPITLAVVAMEVGRRAGIAIEGVGMPGHFLLRDMSGALRDPFEAGRVITVKECAERFHAIHGHAAPFDNSMLAPRPAHDIVARVLANLRQIHVARGDRDALRRVSTLEELARLRGRLN